MYWNIDKADEYKSGYQRLTLTWDVLKLWKHLSYIVHKIWLTLTWDVLKYDCRGFFKGPRVININMRCIEIILHDSLLFLRIRLTLTWDVLK